MAIPGHAPISRAEQFPFSAGKSSTADAGGGLKIGRYGFRFHRGLGAVSPQQASGIYPDIACYYYQRPKTELNVAPVGAILCS